jgi:hypothetical protein
MNIRIACLSSALAALLAPDGAFAVQRAFVSTDGVDNPTCTFTLPCRSFLAATTVVTSPDGEVIVLKSGGYGKVTITTPVSIIAPPGVYAGISVFPGEDGVTVSAGPGDKVVLRGLSINGQGGNNGIRITSGQQTHVEDCTISNLGAEGIRIEGGGKTHIARAVVRSNGGVGLLIATGTPDVYVSDSRFAENGDGIINSAGKLFGNRVTLENNLGDGILSVPPGGSTISTILSDSVSTGNGGAGFAAEALAPGSTVNASATRLTSARNAVSGFEVETILGVVTLVISDSTAVENASFGAVASGSVTAIVSGSTLARNGLADLANNGAVMRTSVNNTLTGRGAPDVSGALTPNPLK